MAKVVAELAPESEHHAVLCARAAVEAGCEYIMLSGAEARHNLNAYAIAVREHFPYLAVGVRRSGAISMEGVLALDTQFGLNITCFANPNQNAAAVGTNLKAIHPTILAQEDTLRVLVFCFVDSWWQPCEDNYTLQVINYPKDRYILATTGSTRRALPSMAKVLQLRQAIGDTPIAVASMMDASQFKPYAAFIDWLIVPFDVPPTQGIGRINALTPLQLAKLIQVAARHPHRDVLIRKVDDHHSKRNHLLEDRHAHLMNLAFED